MKKKTRLYTLYQRPLNNIYVNIKETWHLFENDAFTESSSFHKVYFSVLRLYYFPFILCFWMLKRLRVHYLRTKLCIIQRDHWSNFISKRGRVGRKIQGGWIWSSSNTQGKIYLLFYSNQFNLNVFVESPNLKKITLHNWKQIPARKFCFKNTKVNIFINHFGPILAYTALNFLGLY